MIPSAFLLLLALAPARALPAIPAMWDLPPAAGAVSRFLDNAPPEKAEEPGAEGSAKAPEIGRGTMQANAYAWAIGGTVIPIATAVYLGNIRGDYSAVISTLALGGLFVGPSLGQFYARSPGQAMVGIGIRSTGGLVGIIGLATMIGDAFCGFDSGDEDDAPCEDHGGGAIALAGGLIYLGGVVYSLVDTHAAVDRRLERNRVGRFGMAPVLSAGGQGPLRAGALAWMRF